MADFLRAMAQSSHARAQRAMAQRDIDQLLRLCDDLSPAPVLRLQPTFSVIAEIKASSPAEGALADTSALDRPALAAAYAKGGASAISVLTEPDRFAGDLEHLAIVAASLGSDALPAMRKDFLVNEYQIAEARVAGAGGVLLIAAMLDDEQLAGMLARAQSLGLFVLLECFDDDDIAACRRLLASKVAQDMVNDDSLLLGVNTRDLRTLAVDPGRLSELAKQLPDDVIRVAESGLKVPEDAARAARMGYSVALIGTALMKSASPDETVAAFLSAGSAA